MENLFFDIRGKRVKSSAFTILERDSNKLRWEQYCLVRVCMDALGSQIPVKTAAISQFFQLSFTLSQISFNYTGSQL